MNIKAAAKIKLSIATAFIVLVAFFACPAYVYAADKTPVEKPVLDVSLVYDGTPKTVTLPDSPYYTSESITCVNAGEYTLKVSLTNKNSYCWEDMTTEDIYLDFTVEKALFDVGLLSYSDETYVFDGSEHFIPVKGLPSSAQVIFNTVKSDPGIYPSVARIDLGKNYQNSLITLDGAKLTILAVELKDDGGSFMDERGFNPDIKFTLGKGNAQEFGYKLPAGGGLYATYAPRATLDGEEYDFGTGEFMYRILVPTRYTGVKVYINEGGTAKEADFRWNGHYVEFAVDKMSQFAIVYSGIGEEEAPRLMWLEIALAVIIVVEAAVIVRQALLLKKK